VVEEHNLTETLLTSEITSIIGNPEKWQTMSQAATAFAAAHAAEKIADILLYIGDEHKS
jgi:UDP-N-acetylglucosamine:LPS N-acetylglucosamine transferase